MFFPLRDHNPTSRTPVVTIALIAINVVVFLIEVAQGPEMPRFLARWGATPFELTRGVDLVGFLPGTRLEHVPGPHPLQITALTSMFMHGGWGHLIFNMWYLWIFGNNVEDVLGRWRFLGFYLAVGLVGLLAHVLVAPSSVVPTVGASAAISGMLGAYLLLFPRARVLSVVFLFFLIQFVEVPAILLITVWMLLQIFGGLAGLGTGGAAGGVAYWAHIGGFVAGYLGIRYVFGRDLARLRALQRHEIDSLRGG